jgi:hypothetical protein
MLFCIIDLSLDLKMAGIVAVGCFALQSPHKHAICAFPKIREACFNPTAFFFLKSSARHHCSTSVQVSVELCNRVDLKGNSSPLTEIGYWRFSRIVLSSISWLKIYGTFGSDRMGSCVVSDSILRNLPKEKISPCAKDWRASSEYLKVVFRVGHGGTKNTSNLGISPSRIQPLQFQKLGTFW